MLVFGSVYEFIRGSFSGLPSSLGIQDASAPSYFATTLAVTIFSTAFHGFPMVFLVGGGGAERTSFYGVVFEENEINTLDHT